jgi:hypothetical protein
VVGEGFNVTVVGVTHTSTPGRSSACPVDRRPRRFSFTAGIGIHAAARSLLAVELLCGVAGTSPGSESYPRHDRRRLTRKVMFSPVLKMQNVI